jgi:putative ABC transport system permease protein
MIAGIRMGFANLQLGSSRALLALVGIAIASGALVATLSLGQNAAAEARRQFEEIGIDVLIAYVTPIDPAHPQGFAPGDPDRLKRRIPEIDAVVPIGFVTLDDKVSVIGADSGFFAMNRLAPERGRLLSRFDHEEPFAVLGSRFPSPGKTIRLGSRLFQVVGVAKDTVSNPLMPTDLNTAVYVSLDALPRVMSNFSIGTLVIRLRPGFDQNLVAARIKSLMAPTIIRGAVGVATASQLIEAAQQQARLYSAILLVMALIALIVGGIGIMNMMLTNVLERRSEIGVRKAIGARDLDIALMFLTESMLLCLVGGFAGSGIGMLASYVYTTTAYGSFQLSPLAFGTGSLLAVLSGLAFGFYPALNAARLNPVEALRAN